MERKLIKVYYSGVIETEVEVDDEKDLADELDEICNNVDGEIDSYEIIDLDDYEDEDDYR